MLKYDLLRTSADLRGFTNTFPLPNWLNLTTSSWLGCRLSRNVCLPAWNEIGKSIWRMEVPVAFRSLGVFGRLNRRVRMEGTTPWTKNPVVFVWNKLCGMFLFADDIMLHKDRWLRFWPFSTECMVVDVLRCEWRFCADFVTGNFWSLGKWFQHMKSCLEWWMHMNASRARPPSYQSATILAKSCSVCVCVVNVWRVFLLGV